MYSFAMTSAESLFMFAFDNACINSVFIVLLVYLCKVNAIFSSASSTTGSLITVGCASFADTAPIFSSHTLLTGTKLAEPQNFCSSDMLILIKDFAPCLRPLPFLRIDPSLLYVIFAWFYFVFFLFFCQGFFKLFKI